jgi:hypothetical protein
MFTVTAFLYGNSRKGGKRVCTKEKLMSTPDDLYDFAKTLIKQAEALLAEKNVELRKQLPVTEYPESIGAVTLVDARLRELMSHTRLLYEYALGCQQGEHTEIELVNCIKNVKLRL